jgi:UDP-glucose 4-epimerase
VSRDLIWVVGRGGLLGSHLVRRISTERGEDFQRLANVETFDWHSQPTLSRQLDEWTANFVKTASTGGFASWTVLWAAGAGVVGTSPHDLAVETATFAYALERLANHHRRHDRRVPGMVFLASSAGGLYGQGPDSPATERSPCVPISDYGREKQRQEDQLSRWAHECQVSCMIGRISNLYGPGQNLRKQQGLISHLLRGMILGQPVHVYVPMDTLRDYFHAQDCAAAILRATRRLNREAVAAGAPLEVTKIFASEQPRSISSLIGIVSRVTRRRPLLIHASRPLAQQQARCLWFRSEVRREDTLPLTIDLPVGVSQVYHHLTRLLQEARLFPPTASSARSQVTRAATPNSAAGGAS